MKFFIVTLLAVSCAAVPYGNSYSAGSYGSALSSPKLATGLSGLTTGYAGYGAGLSSNNYNTQNQGSYSLLTLRNSQPRQEVVKAAIHQLGRSWEYNSVPYQDAPIEAQIIEVEPSEVPVHLHFKTKSSNVVLSQSHENLPVQEVEKTSSQEEPTRLYHEIQKPVIQEVHEVITPYRQIVQTVEPLKEAIHTVVTKAEGARALYQAKPYQPTNYGQTYQPANYRQTYQAQNLQAFKPLTAAVQSSYVQSVAPVQATLAQADSY